jgi:hypothetical protein
MLVEDITFDPLLASFKLIADAYSPINVVCKVKNIIYKSLLLFVYNEYNNNLCAFLNCQTNL